MTARYQIITGDNRSTLKTIPDSTIDAIVTDPPYGIDFLGKAWDANTGALETYQECLRVLKPGGHILAFSAARTYHHLAVTLEQAGFEIRDQIMWIYSSGFPKSQDVGRTIDRAANKAKETIKNGTKKSRGEKIEGFDLGSGIRCPECNRDSNARYSCEKSQACGMVFRPQTKEAERWAGWGTALKPAHEPICLARKPMRLSIARNCQEWGVGALNIDATRIPYENDKDVPVPHGGKARQHKDNPGWMSTTGHKIIEDPQINEIGRFPANVIGDIPDYQKYFYCPKVSRRERHIGFDDFTSVKTMMEQMKASYVDQNDQIFVPQSNEPYMIYIPGKGKVYPHGLKHEYAEWCKANNKNPGNVGNNHPTVKPIELMKYLIRLITPPGGTVLDPFAGSGSTGCAAVELGHDFIGCELDPAYVAIANRRIQAWLDESLDPQFRALFDVE